MTDRKRPDWNAATWEGQRRAMLRGALRLNVRERLQALENLCDTDRFFQAMREQGRFRYGEHDMNDFQQEVAGVAETQGDWRKEDTRNEIPLTGCTPVPLASYLKALGILRLVAEQADANARGYWANEHFVLVTTLGQDALRYFLLHEYRPTPLLSPWNGGSGFYREGNETAWTTLSTVRAATAARWQPYREAVHAVSSIIEVLGLTGKPEGEAKHALLRRLRSSLAEEFLSWLDAAVLLTDTEPLYPPILGTGGNDGRLDFTSNYMQRLLEMFDVESGRPTGDTTVRLDTALFGSVAPGLTGNAIGQFSPGASGGPNSSTGFGSGSLVNPWDYVLMLEGALLFAAAATRRLEGQGRAALSYPFTVRPSGVGAGATALGDEAPARAEVWMPLWSRPASLSELRTLLGEGRATLGRTRARDGLDFVRAVAGLGVERGIEAFQRYAFMMRAGKAYLATPLNRILVRHNPKAELIDQLDRNDWLSRFRRAARNKSASARLQGLARRLEDALFDLARTTDPRTVQQVLTLLGMVQMVLASSPGLSDEVKPVPLLGRDWVFAALDDSDEFRVAAALAGLDGGLPMRMHLAPIDPDKTWDWKSDSRLAVWGQGAIENNLAHVLERRLLEADRNEKVDPWMGRCPADLSAVAAFLGRMTDDRRIAELLAGLACCRVPEYLPGRDQGASGNILPAAYALMKPLFTSNAQLHELGVLRDDQHLPLPTAIPRLLRADRTGDALRLARQRRRASGLPDAGWRISEANISGPRLLAALMLPMTNYAIKALESRISMQNIHESERTTG